MNSIEVQNLSKKFLINSANTKSIKQSILNLFGNSKQQLTVLDDISFDIQPGEFVGIIGSNGCGKSTLLKMLAGIIQPDSGSIQIHGKLSPFLELGVGFQEELSAIDNIYLYGSLLGMTKQQIDARLDEIIAFSELEKFTNTPLKHFSSGMYVRLAFSVAIHVDFDILLLDEVLAVGDYTFQQKCFQKFNDIKQSHKTVIFVSHDIHTVSKICHRCIWLESGQIKQIGSAEKVSENYMSQITRPSSASELHNSNSSSDPVSVKSVSFQPAKKGDVFQSGDQLPIHIDFELQSTIVNPVIGINIYNQTGVCVFALNTDYYQLKLGSLNAGRHQINFLITQYLAHGEYSISVAFCDHTKTKILYSQENLLYFKVINKQYYSDGLTDFPSQIKLIK